MNIKQQKAARLAEQRKQTAAVLTRITGTVCECGASHWGIKMAYLNGLDADPVYSPYCIHCDNARRGRAVQEQTQPKQKSETWGT